jgi:hypothetical protein
MLSPVDECTAVGTCHWQAGATSTFPQCAEPQHHLRCIARATARAWLKPGMCAAALSLMLAATNTSNDRSALHSVSHSHSRQSINDSLILLGPSNNTANIAANISETHCGASASTRPSTLLKPSLSGASGDCPSACPSAGCRRADYNGTHVKAICAPAMHSWTRRDPPRPPGAASGLSMKALASRPACRLVYQYCAEMHQKPKGAYCMQKHWRLNIAPLMIAEMSRRVEHPMSCCRTTVQTLPQLVPFAATRWPLHAAAAAQAAVPHAFICGSLSTCTLPRALRRVNTRLALPSGRLLLLLLLLLLCSCHISGFCSAAAAARSTLGTLLLLLHRLLLLLQLLLLLCHHHHHHHHPAAAVCGCPVGCCCCCCRCCCTLCCITCIRGRVCLPPTLVPSIMSLFGCCLNGLISSIAACGGSSTHASNDVAALQPQRGCAGQQNSRRTRCYVSGIYMSLNTVVGVRT